MWNLSMYPVKGNCRFPNIMEQLDHGSVESVTVESGDITIEEWQIGINITEIDGEMHLIPFITYEEELTPKCRLECYLGIDKTTYRIRMKTDLSSKCHFRAGCMKVSDLKPEILNNGALIIKYGIRVEAVYENDIWHFQLLTDQFDSKGKQVMIPFRENETDRCHAQIKAIHDNSIEIKGCLDFSRSLQIAHGVRYHESASDLASIAYEAHLMGLRNVVHYCEWQLIQDSFIWSERSRLNIALNYDMRIGLAHFIREINSKEKLLSYLNFIHYHYDVMISGEAMKTFMKFILYD